MDPLSASGAVNTALNAVAKVINYAKDFGTSFYKDTSLVGVTKLTRVEPITIVSKDLLNNPTTKIVLNALLADFVAYYLQAVDILTKVQDVEVVKILDRLNPDRDETGFLLSERVARESFAAISTEHYQFRLPTKSRPALETLNNKSLAGSKEVGEGQDIELDALVNLSIGRVVNVKVAYSKTEGEYKGEVRSVTIPVSVRLMVSSISNDSITRIMTYKSEDLSLSERFHSARAGRIEYIRDLMFCQDLIDEYKKAVIQDPTNVLSEITRRTNNAKKYGLLTKNPSLVAASTLFVISDSVVREVEQKLGGKFDNPRIREKAFENTYAMIVAVVSEEWSTVTFYVRGIARGATFGFKELEGKTKGTGPDITDIMKALTAGQPPSF